MASAQQSLWADLGDGLSVHRTQAHHAEALERLQLLVFPTLSDDERFKAEHYLRHLELFPQGQFVVVANGEQVVGMTTTLRLDFNLAHSQHRFADVFAGGWLSSHQPLGQWLYGADIGTDPAFRGRGIARALYAARHHTVAALGLRGQLTVGMPSGLGALSDTLSPDQYYSELVTGQRTDPTLSAQIRIGFEPRGLIADYINDPVCAGYGVLLVLPADRPVALRART